MRNDRRVIITGLIALIILVSAGAAFGQENIVSQYGDRTLISWPGDAGVPAWTAITSLNDGAGVSNSMTDLCGEGATPGVYFSQADDGSYIYFRVRVNYAGTVTDVLTGIGTIMILINRTGGTHPDNAFAWDFKEATPGHGLEMLVQRTNGTQWIGFRMNDADSNNANKVSPPDFAYGADKTDGFVRTIDQQSTAWGNTVFVDFAIKCSYLTLTSGTGLACGQNWKIQVGSINNANDHNWVDADIAGGKSPSDNVADSWVQGTSVDLSSLDVRDESGKALLTWQTQSETDNAGFHVWRAAGADVNYVRISDRIIPAQGSSARGALYTFEDAAVLPGFTYYYKIEDIDMNGTSRFHGPIVFVLGTITLISPAEGVRAPARAPLRFRWDGGPFTGFKLEFSASPRFSGSVLSLPAPGAGPDVWLSESVYLPNAREWERIKSAAGASGTLYWRIRGINGAGAGSVSATRSLKLTSGRTQ